MDARNQRDPRYSPNLEPAPTWPPTGGPIEPQELTTVVVLQGLRTDMYYMREQVNTLGQKFDKLAESTMSRADAERRFTEDEGRIKSLEDWRLQSTGQRGADQLAFKSEIDRTTIKGQSQTISAAQARLNVIYAALLSAACSLIAALVVYLVTHP